VRRTRAVSVLPLVAAVESCGLGRRTRKHPHLTFLYLFALLGRVAGASRGESTIQLELDQLRILVQSHHRGPYNLIQRSCRMKRPLSYTGPPSLRHLSKPINSQ
jgi:hypothetical protein